MIKIILLILGLLIIQTSGEEMDDKSKVFLERYCYECHDEDIQKGKLDLSKLSFNLEDRSVYEKWLKVYDNINHGDMPPKKKKRPDLAQAREFLSTLSTYLLKADVSSQKIEGRGRIRRLNRHEIEATLSDIFNMKVDIKDMLPEDATNHGFDTVGEALNISSVQIESYMEALDVVLDQATAFFDEPKRKKYDLTYRESYWMMHGGGRLGNAYAVKKEGIVFFAPQKKAYLNPLLDQFAVTYPGEYKVSVWAKSVNTEKSQTLKVRLGGAGSTEDSRVPKTLLGFVDVKPHKIQKFNFKNHLRLGQQFRIYPPLLPYMRFTGKLAGRQGEFKGPGVLVHKITVDGPIISQWPPKSHELLWGGINTEKIPNVKAYSDVNKPLDKPPTLIAKPRMKILAKRDKKTGHKVIYDPKMGIGGEKIYKSVKKPKARHAMYRLAPQDPKADAAKLIRRFVPVAFRRHASELEINGFVKLANRWLDDGISFENTMRATYKAILTSPEFLYQKPAFTNNRDLYLNDVAFAERLSYFLWSSKPDNHLNKLAASGKLRDKNVLYSEIERMIKDPRFERFYDNFLGQWLDLRLMEFTSPNTKLYPEHDDVLQWSLKEEPKAFFKELISKNLSVLNVIDSNFAMVNDRLSRHYDLPLVKGTHLRKVRLPGNSPRGGVLGMGAIHKVTANGTTTSPVVRGVWILENIMGIHPPPPPPGVPAIEPDIRGAVSVIDQLSKHRNNKSCKSCHQLIDPPGVALENFDVIGKWRDNYRAITEAKAGKRISYHPIKKVPIFYHKGLPVVAADVTKDGRRFNDIREFKKILLRSPDAMARNVLEKLIIYSTGSEVRFADRYEVSAIVAKLRDKNYGMKSMIHELVNSKIFQRK